MRTHDVIIIGGGAAGLMCAMTAGQRGKRVAVLERNAEVGAKILISGGGRCNFTNRDATPERFVSGNPHFARSALARYTAPDFIALVEKHRIAHYEKTLGQLFCEGDRSARKIVRMLLDEGAAAHVDVRTGINVQAVRKADDFVVETNAGEFAAPNLVLATGGVSIPKIGATDFSLRIARRFGLRVTPIRPGLTPMTLRPETLARTKALAGVSAEVVLRVGAVRFREAALFTHRGLSGPAILQISNYWKAGEEIAVDWAPDLGEDALVAAKRERPKAFVKSHLERVLPARLAAFLAESAPQSPLGDVRDDALREAMRALKDWRVTPSGLEGFDKAEVMAGGVETDELSQQSMQTKRVPGLHVIGEAVDVTGWLGGYNFQWAWSSGYCAGQAIAT
ncbi:MAG: aminoacetone oxidase family FAD-binding enzyme [Alphaproteobacteria bacterium]|nr:aminoacetone oxidase family FAD-binding enzyme [Alphaproteobacteria bacterium]